MDETGRLQRPARNITVCGHSDINIECRTWLCLMSLECHPADNGITRFRVCQDPAKGQEGGTFRAFHLTLQPEPLTIQDESCFEPGHHV